MLSNGMYSAGYKAINLDDCWEGLERDEYNNIQWDSDRFPDGIPYKIIKLHFQFIKKFYYFFIFQILTF